METSSPQAKRCSKCHEEKPIDQFSRDTRKRDGLQSYCSSCGREAVNAWNAANPERKRADHLMRRFGLTVADYESLADQQGGVCTICAGTCPTGRRLAVDHDHDTGRVRGLLCWECNTGIGKLKDSPAVLSSALRYLHHHGKALTSDELEAHISALQQSPEDPTDENPDL